MRFLKAVGACGALLWIFVTSAVAHHPAGGRLPVTWTDGLLSGLGHPVIGVDHLVFLVVLALIAAVLRDSHQIIVSFAVALLIGVLLQLVRPNLPMIEVLVAGSVLLVGVALLLQRINSLRLWTLIAVATGLLHGYALGEPIVGAPFSALVSYLIGLALAQVLIMIPAKAVAERLLLEERAKTLKVQAAGGAVMAIGMFFVASAIASP